MQQDRVPLYETFGKFMGQPAEHGSDNFVGIIKRARQHGLKVRFIDASAAQDDIGNNLKRLNVITNDDTKRVNEITIG